jgi:hypothetical protein
MLAAFCFSQSLSDFIVIDQFGYREQAKKTAVIRVPQKGYGSPSSYSPGTSFQVVKEASGEAIFSGTPTSLNGGQTDTASGDKIWWFDFSSVTTPGRYYILDQTNNLRSFPFSIANDVYNKVLKAAIKVLYYQRAGTDKPKQYAGEAWADGSNFLQDKQTRDFFKKDDASTERDLSGGWFDAGDYNKYTEWTSRYVSDMLLAYEENPDVFTDDYGIPESGNGVPDILDEAKWGVAWLLKMQNADGSVLSVQGLKDGSPPSSVTEASYYGPANTVATFGSAKAFAIASRIFGARGETLYAEDLKSAALKAWNWAEAHPDSIFHNNCGDDWNKENCPDYDSRGLAAGDQERTDSWDRVESRISAALALYELTGEDAYLTIFEKNWEKFPLHAWGGCMQQYRFSQHILLMRYLAANYGSASIKSTIKNDFTTAFAKSDLGCNHFGKGFQSDGYRSYIYDYQWGSNKIKADQGLTYYKWNIVDQSKDYKDVAEDYLHYIHGVNPFNMVYLTNMKSCEASKSVTTIYHTWFSEESTKWGIAAGANPGPAPGYMPGGPNQKYKLADCCPSNCGDWGNSRCSLVALPQNQPPAKMYKEMNHSWPLDSWEITEPSNGYQISYIILLSKFVENGSSTPVKNQKPIQNFKVTQNQNFLQIFGSNSLRVSLYNASGKLLIKEQSNNGNLNINLQSIPKGVYIVQILNGSVKETKIIAR